MSVLNLNENELVMESMVSQEVETKAKKVSKSLTMNEKRSMYNILSFLVIANRDGLLDDTKTQELMEHLPIFKTISEKKEYLSQEMFDMDMIEKDILKPMVAEHNIKKKQEKKEEKKKGKKEKETEGVLPKEEVKQKEPKKRAPKKEKVVEDAEIQKEVVEEEPKKETKKRAPKESKKKEKVVEAEGESEVLEKDQKKRGRKAKQQIVECNTEVNVNAGNSQEDQLADLVNQLTVPVPVPVPVPVLELKHPDPEEIDLADLDEVLSNLEEGEVQEKEKVERVMTPRLPEVEVEKKGKETKKVVTKTKNSKK
jgi:hypothetical protein